ncbi:hypothetical protein SPACI_028030 [Sporomusa acidovorans DSM 3132]|uniref:Uncharacterized protein n=1 Tax=Sporomusa acidovorans (strain ATCC 49682 / DSM 3132 / Mol) TaxID=1123286 RepID=A0ABZ3J3H7_SPOA4|nr:hypothetical protein SPACI_26440 [Sporomusa acidovorans DSM 3132]SDD40698.1 hypothetical protein SAMN04488499_1001141 [Sporomusa acidovorans]
MAVYSEPGYGVSPVINIIAFSISPELQAEHLK